MNFQFYASVITLIDGGINQTDSLRASDSTMNSLDDKTRKGIKILMCVVRVYEQHCEIDNLQTAVRHTDVWECCYYTVVTKFATIMSVQRPVLKSVLTSCIWQPVLYTVLKWLAVG